MARLRILRPHIEEDVPLVDLARDAGVSYRTALRWKGQYHARGLAGLADDRRSDRGKLRGVPRDLQHFVEGLALRKPRLSAATIHRKVVEIATLRGDRAPSYRQVYNVIRRLPADLTTLAHDGDKAYRDMFDLVHRREAAGPNAIWQADHTLLDIVALRDDGRHDRPWLTVVMDDHSRAVAGFFLTWDAPSAIQTALALRQAIWRKADPRWSVCGVPDVLYTDNGSDFRSQHLEQVAADLKMQLIFSTPGHPRGRGRIERFFSTVSQLFLSDQPGFLGPGGRQAKDRLLTLTELERRFEGFVLGTYNARVHGETGEPPRQRWQADGFLPRLPESLEQLDLLLLTVPKARKVHADGIRFHGHRYVEPTLAAFVGETVTLRYDPRDMGEIRVFDDNGFVCRAICPDLAGETVALRDIVRARNERRRDLRRTLADREKVVDELMALKRLADKPAAEPDADPTPLKQTRPAPPPLKRYRNE